MLKTRAIFNRKVDDFEPKNCVIEKVITLTANEYDKFSHNMPDNYDFIKDNKDLQYFDTDGICHCILVAGEERSDAILVRAEGYDYARYAAFMPNASAFLAAAIKQEQSSDKVKAVQSLKLKDLMAVPLEDIHLIHSKEDIELATIKLMKKKPKKSW